MVQFISFLSMQMTPEELKRKLPNLLELSRDYFISPDVAFALWRRTFTGEIMVGSFALSISYFMLKV